MGANISTAIRYFLKFGVWHISVNSEGQICKNPERKICAKSEGPICENSESAKTLKVKCAKNSDGRRKKSQIEQICKFARAGRKI